MKIDKGKVFHKYIADYVIKDDSMELLNMASKSILFTEPLPTLKDAQQILINEALERSNGNQTIAAKMIGLTRKALNNRLRRIRKN